MGDTFMLLVVVAVILSPFLPQMLKSKCPVCGKRKMEHIETVNTTESGGAKKFITYYRCHKCNSRFQRDRSGPLQKIEPVEEIADESESTPV